MLNSIWRACIQQAVHAESLYVTTAISVGNSGESLSTTETSKANDSSTFD